MSAAPAPVEQEPIELQANEQQMLQETVQLHAEARAALKNLQMAGSLYAVAGEAASSTQRLFDRGAADVLQLNQGLNGLQQAQLELARAMAEWNRVRLRLELLDALQGLHPAEP